MIVAPRSRRLAAAVLSASVLLTAWGCGGDDSGAGGGGEPPEIEALRFPRGTSVGDGLGGPVPISASVRRAARAAGCTVVSVPSEGADHEDGLTYSDAEPLPSSGPHDPAPVEWGVFEEAPPPPRLTHNLEHGGVVVQTGSRLSPTNRSDLLELWREAPPFVVLTPQGGTAVPAAGVTVTSWQRLMNCPRYTRAARAAIASFRDAYRGRGPEALQALNPPEGQESPPVPAIPDRRAVQ